MKLSATILGCIFLCQSVVAEPVPITFHTVPQAKVYLVNDESANQSGDEFLGESNRTLAIDFDQHTSRPWTIYFLPLGSRPGQSPPLAQQTLYPGALKQTRQYPADQVPIQLPLSGLNLIRQWASQPWPYLGFLLLSGAIAWALRRNRRPQLSPTTAIIGAQLDRFTLVSSLGKGGFGEVFHAIDDQGQSVALKVLRGELTSDPAHEKRFLREIQICSRLNHPNLIRIYDWGQHEDILYLVMELLEGQTLGDRLNSGPFEPGVFQKVALQVGEALQVLHDEGIVHRDIKPDNLFLLKNGNVKLMDFGISRSQEMTRATQTGLALGTPTYMAPEQIQGQLDPASDQYSFGVVAFLALTGRRPFEADDPMAVAYQHVNQAAPRPSQFNPGLSREVDAVITRMLAKNPRSRYAKVSEACRALSLSLVQNPAGDEDTQALEF